ncbi:MAG: tetratricopeptide repeat protein [Acidobacteriota bacterium]|nr:tetratricopeptide repeat protein [Acidobacteriota bacterium]
MLKNIFTIALLAVSVRTRPSEPQALYQLGREAIAHGDADKAIEYLEKAVALKPNDARYHYQLAGAYGQSAATAGMFSKMSIAGKAKGEFQRAIEIDPNFLPARIALVEFDLLAPALMGGSEEAAIEQATEIRKRDAIEGHRAFARIDVAAKKLDLARNEYVAMLKEQPSSARAHYFYGVYLMLTEKNYKAASDELESVVKLDASYMPAYFQIGHVAALSGANLTRGEEALRKYLAYRPKEDEPSIARAYFWLGGIYEKQGRKADAKASYAASLKINPNQKDADEALKRVS